MKKLLIFLPIAIIIFSLTGKVQASPIWGEYYITFEGSIDVVDDSAGIIANAGIELGSMVSYTIYYDTSRWGSVTYQDGITEVWPQSDAGATHFFADYIKGSALEQKDGGIHNEPHSYFSAAEYNLMYVQFSFPPYATYFQGGSSDDPFRLRWIDYSEGASARAYNTAYDSLGNSSYLEADLVITKISPVPIPSALLLFGSGLIGFVGLRRKSKE